jgi:hypothetical protein
MIDAVQLLIHFSQKLLLEPASQSQAPDFYARGEAA